MSTKNHKERLLYLISKDDIDSTFKELKILFSNSPKLKEVIFQQGRYKSLEKSINLGIISYELKDIQKNKIRNSLLNLIYEIDTKHSNNAEILKELNDYEQIILGNQINQNIRDNISGDKMEITNNNSISPKVILSILIPLLFTFLIILFVTNSELETSDNINNPDLEIISLRWTKDGELDITLRNITENAIVISAVGLRILKNHHQCFEPILEPSAKYKVNIDEIRTGNKKLIPISHFINGHQSDRILIDVSSNCSYDLEVIFKYNNGKELREEVSYDLDVIYQNHRNDF